MTLRRCPCLSGATLDACCGPIVDGALAAPTAERLMRSRYSAFALGRADWLVASWHPSTQPPSVELGPERWIGLEIEATEAGGPTDATGSVAFAARWAHRGEIGVVHERSRFARDLAGAWRYLDGTHLP